MTSGAPGATRFARDETTPPDDNRLANPEHAGDLRPGGLRVRLITGGSGVLGRALIAELLDRGETVRLLDLHPPPPEFPGRIEYLPGSVLDPEPVRRALVGVETVYHLAASMPQAKLSVEGFHRLNVGGTMLVAEAAAAAGSKRFVFASTIEIYGLHLPHEFPVREEAEKRLTGIYSRNKWECEQRLLELSGRTGMSVAFTRMPMIFGPGFYHETAMLTLFRLIRRGWPVPIAADPSAPWASVSAADGAQGLRLCGEVPAADGEAFNIAAADAPACVDTVRELIALAGSRSKPLLLPRWLMNTGVNLMEKFPRLSPTPAELVRFALVGGVYAIDKARAVLGYEPRFRAAEGMLQALDSACPA